MSSPPYQDWCTPHELVYAGGQLWRCRKCHKIEAMSNGDIVFVSSRKNADKETPPGLSLAIVFVDELEKEW